MFFARMRVSAYAGFIIFQVIKKKKFIGFSFKFLYFYYPKECVLFEKRLCFKPKYIHFVYSFVAYVTFSSSCLCRLDQFVVFFPRGAPGHAVVMVNDTFSDLPFFW